MVLHYVYWWSSPTKGDVQQFLVLLATLRMYHSIVVYSVPKCAVLHTQLLLLLLLVLFSSLQV
jgi:hypothetical protein